MVTREDELFPAIARYRLANSLIWIGVLTWAPFILLRFAGETPNLFLFLPFHLLGVVGGSRLKAAARRDLGEAAPQKTRLRTLGHILVFTGIMVWVIYFFLKLVVHMPVEVGQFLPFHLTAMLSGVVILFANFWRERRKLRITAEIAESAERT
jgi:polyferredoxin